MWYASYRRLVGEAGPRARPSRPIWSPDGRKLFYRFGDRFYEVPVSRNPRMAIGKPSLLFAVPAVNQYVFGNGFLLAKVADPVVSATSIHVVLHWIDDLKRRTR